MRIGGRGAVLWLLLVASCAPGSVDDEEPAGSGSQASDESNEVVDAGCVLPDISRTVIDADGAVLIVWELPYHPVLERHVLPADSGYLRYRAAVRADGADLRRPVSDEPDPETAADAELWTNERFNAELAHSGEVGAIDPITCLDALFFAYQNRRIPQLESPTELLVSVLRRETEGAPELAAVFGAGSEMFPPKSVYGFETVDTYLADGWRYWYALHNHTLQTNGDRLALGNPTLSTSDVQLTRSLVANRRLESARVTNGFYTFTVPGDELGRFRSR